MTQVELAQLLYMRPRLTRMWTHLERIEGGIGSGKGPGEKQLETDRRLVDTRISELKRKLREVEKRLTMSDAWLNRRKPTVSYKLPAPLPTTFQQEVPLYFDLMNLALQTDSTRILTFNIMGWAKSSGLAGVNHGYHALTHHGQDPERLRQLAIIESFYGHQLARFLANLKKLQATPDRPEALLVGHVPAASGTYELVFEDVKVPVENRLGEEGEGFKIAMQTLNKTRIPVAAGSVGVARRALDEARKYAKERQAFGQPIANFQAIQFKLADMLIGIETARMYTYYAAWLADQGLPHAHASAIAKAYASEIAFEAANQAIQIHGGYGYVREFPVEKLLRDVKLNQIYEGTNEIQRLIIARHILAE